MKIYKFKDLTNERKHSQFLQIVLQNSIWCASPDSLNDADEFKFKLDYEPSPRTPQLLSAAVAKYRTTNHLPPHVSVSLALQHERLETIAAQIIDDIISECRATIGITSFSITKNDVNLWERYGGNGNGACVEIAIPDHLVGQSYHRVHYVSDKMFHVDSFLESVVFPDKRFETFRNILLTKTKKWSEEEEIRFIGNRQDVNLIVDGHISEVIFGPSVPTRVLEELEARIASHCNAHKISIKKLEGLSITSI